MPNPLLSLTPILEILSNNLSILPATGTAVEDLQHPDKDEIDDILVHKDMGAADIWRPTKSDLEEIQESLAELK